MTLSVSSVMILQEPGAAGDPSISVAAGITVGLIASLVQSLGLTIQRKSHILNESRLEEERTPGYRRPLWLLGFAVFITSNILGSIFQIASLPVVILAPLGAVSLLWNAFFARLLLGDVFSKFMVLGTLLIVAGAVLIGIYGIVPEPTHSLDDLLLLFGRKSFVVYFTLLGIAVLVILVITHIIEWNYSRRRIALPETPPLSPVLPTSPTIIDVTASERTPLMDGKFSRAPSPMAIDRSTTPTLLAVSYASMSGLLSGMCLLFAKSGVELLVLTAAGDNQFGRWESWVLVLGLVVFALLQLWYLHKSLILEDPTLVCPLAFCSYNLSSILNGLIYFDQFDRLSGLHLGLVILGIFILLGGVWALSRQDSELDGGIREGAWPAAEPEVASPRPPHPRSVTVASPRSGDDTLLPHAPNRRTVSSPSALSFPPLSSPSRSPELAARAELSPDFESDVTPVLWPHTIRDSQIIPQSPPLSPVTATGSGPVYPLSPHRRRGTRRVSMLSPGGENLSGVGGPPIGGFSIGLSPLSPGFSLIPRQRESQTTDTPAADESASGPSAMGIQEDGQSYHGGGIENRRPSRFGLRRIFRWAAHPWS